MATSESELVPPERLVETLRKALAGPAGTDPADAERLACLLAGRARFRTIVGAPPGGVLEGLPPGFEEETVLEAASAALATARLGAGDTATSPATIGAAYGSTLPSDDRASHGQFFTPAALADALVAWALDGASPSDGLPRVLDPAVGTGTFLLSALRALRRHVPTVEPNRALDRLVGVDVDPAALHLAGLRLAAAADVPAPATLSLHHRSFFDCEPAGPAADPDEAFPLEPVDAVVGNPPFVRAEDLQPDAGHFRRHLAAFGPAGETPWLDGADALSRRSDAYVYFVTHATRFLRPGGRLALVLPTKWLMSDYGEGLRRFLRGRYRVHAVVGFAGRAFGEALVDTSVLLAERDAAADGRAPLRFVRLDDTAAPDALLAAVAASTSSDRERSAAVAQPQSVLTAEGSLARYLEAPAELLTLLDGAPFVRLDELAEVARGTMTGANRFFFVDDGTVERFGLERRFLRPAVKSLRWVDRPVVGASDVARQVVDVHPFVDALGRPFGDDPPRAVTAALSEAGHDGLAAYVEHAERAGWHEGRTCQSRTVWFDLGPLRAPAAFVPKLLRERVFAVRNAAGAVPSNAIDGVWPAEGVDAGALLAVLNASVGRAAMEVTGRDEAGLLQLMTYETASLPTLDVRRLGSSATRSLASAGEAYARDPGPEALAALDEAVDAAFDLPMAGPTLREHAGTLRRRRVDDGEIVAVPPG